MTLRLVMLPPDEQGHVRGALSVELDPGWKTYWIAPGPVGLAPRLDYAASTGLEQVGTRFPVPLRFNEGEARSVGYDEPVAFAIHAEATGPSPVLRVNAFLGVCRELCVPVQASLTATPSRSLSDRALTARAEATAPTETGSLAARTVRWNADRSALMIDVEPAGAQGLDVFAAAEDGWSFGEPTARTDGSPSTLALPVVVRPSATADLETVDLLLTTGERAQLSRAMPIAPR